MFRSAFRKDKGDGCYVIGNLGFTRWTPSGTEEPEQRFQVVIGGIADECPESGTTRKRKPWARTPKANEDFFAALAAGNEAEPTQ